MEPVTVARHAMATRFEIVLYGEDPSALRSAGEEALEEIDRLEDQLSLFRPTSEISHINCYGVERPVRVTPTVFRLLEQAQRLCLETGGAFDPTVAPLVRCWGFLGGKGAMPSPQELKAARQCVGMQWVEFDEANFTVRFTHKGMMMDLGAVGKGYAIERAASVLVEAGVTCAFLHGGTSSSMAIGAPPGDACWKAAIPHPCLAASSMTEGQEHSLFATVPMRNESLGVSAVWGKSFSAGGRSYGHVIDPRSGEPVQRAALAAVVLPSATETDALSTALLTLGPEGMDLLARLRPNVRALLAIPGAGSGGYDLLAQGVG